MISLPNLLKKVSRGALIGLGGTVLAAVLWFFGVLDVFEAKTWDWRQRILAKPGSATTEVALVLLDQKRDGITVEWDRRRERPL